jgi:hypothetical protein
VHPDHGDATIGGPTFTRRRIGLPQYEVRHNVLRGLDRRHSQQPRDVIPAHGLRHGRAQHPKIRRALLREIADYTSDAEALAYAEEAATPR